MVDDNQVGFYGNAGAGWGLIMNTQTSNVGLGFGAFFPTTPSPQARLHVFGFSNLASTPLAIIESSDTQMPISFRTSPGGEKARIRADFAGNLFLATTQGVSKDIHFRAGDDDTSDMFIRASNGNVGIGTTSPNAKLQVVGGDAAITTQNSGLILRAIDGPLCFRLTVNSVAMVVAIPVTCP